MGLIQVVQLDSQTPEQLWAELPPEIRLLIPKVDAWGLSRYTREERLKKEIHRRRRLSQLLANGIDIDTKKQKWAPREITKKREAFKRACAADPIFEIENTLWTRDPEGRMGLGKQLPMILFDYQRKFWIEPWTKDLDRMHVRRIHKKDRRMRMTITRMAFEKWKFRYVPSSHSWVCTDKDSTLDSGEDWNSLFGKFRFFWKMARTYYPWLYPPLPSHSDVNKAKYLRYPEKDYDTGRTLEEDRLVIGNEIYGDLPSDVAMRGGAAGEGFVDEAAWIEKLEKAVGSFDDMTPKISYVSSPGPNRKVYFERAASGELLGFEINKVTWLMDPEKVAGIMWATSEMEEWPYAGEYRGHSKLWRSPAYRDGAKGKTPEEMARNWDGDCSATAGGKVYRNYNPDVVCGSTDPEHPSYDLYDPNLELQVWVDVGRDDPWSFIWVQIDRKLGWVNIVDYWMKRDVTVHWWVPLLKGWPLRAKDKWVSAPEALPWNMVVKRWYTAPEEKIIDYWYKRRIQRHQGAKIALMCGDFIGSAHGFTDLMSVGERVQHYQIPWQSHSVSHQMDALYEHADEVMLRTRISGRLVGIRPEGLWPSIDDCFLFWRRGESSESRHTPAKPLHDEYSHTGTAYLYGARYLPATIQATLSENRTRIVEPSNLKPGPVRYVNW